MEYAHSSLYKGNDQTRAKPIRKVKWQVLSGKDWSSSQKGMLHISEERKARLLTKLGRQVGHSETPWFSHFIRKNKNKRMKSHIL